MGKEIISRKECTGCHACLNICPNDAIVMVEDEKGFKYPNIDEEKCIKCGLCKKVCPIISKKEEKVGKPIAFACYNKNYDERIKSSSGGIFVLLAKAIINSDGCVFGARFNEKLEVVHSWTDNKEEIEKFMTSKYTQSTIGNTYKEAKQFLDNGRYVLYTGTPCQIEGLKSYLQKDYDNLYTQDIICHGVPSPRVWKKYIDFQKSIHKNENIKEVSFRNKDDSWSSYNMKICFDTYTYSQVARKDLFIKAFLSNVCLRESCYNCHFKKKYRESDITLADYWGVNNIHPEMNDDKGISLVMVHSDKGMKLFNNISSNIEYKETNLDDALIKNPSALEPACHCKNESKFINDIDKMRFDKLVSKYVPKRNIVRKVLSRIKKCFNR